MRSFWKNYAGVMLAVLLIAGAANYGLERAVALTDQTTVIDCPAAGSAVMATAQKEGSPLHKVHVITLFIPSA